MQVTSPKQQKPSAGSRHTNCVSVQATLAGRSAFRCVHGASKSECAYKYVQCACMCIAQPPQASCTEKWEYEVFCLIISFHFCVVMLWHVSGWVCDVTEQERGWDLPALSSRAGGSLPKELIERQVVQQQPSIIICPLLRDFPVASIHRTTCYLGLIWGRKKIGLKINIAEQTAGHLLVIICWWSFLCLANVTRVYSSPNPWLLKPLGHVLCDCKALSCLTTPAWWNITDLTDLWQKKPLSKAPSLESH